ncbi:helix-turn-helix transcriptional regulator [Actinopolymorpha pittospori]|uniref:DNA-binding transcriptional regulator YafY n=1 Tax=Actinopolymorpha pittospori TaxID=648752 RepID=A0A927RCN1_9ACTN|nr:YafY family protein [Actinopolymorpha pittospori]MBE1610084.1 putative DNA-binding transcriptional regulator YafY [Actinopolymorpha pittospori]
MLETSARLLRMLSLLQSRRDWPGAELAEHLGVTTRTVRRDVDRLRDLGYPVESATGTTGGYRLGVGAALPPLLLDDDEAVAVAVGLRAAATGTVTGIEETSLRALAKLEQVLPSRLRHRVDAMQSAILPLTGPGPTVDPDLLTALAAACRAHEGIRFGYQQRTRRVEPYRLVHTGRRWYLLAFDLERDDWRTFRVDRLDSDPQPGPRFTPRPEPAEGLHTYISNALTASPYRYQATVLFHAPLDIVAEHTSPTAGRLEPRDADSCLFHAGGDSLDKIALFVALKGVDFEVLAPPELKDHIRALANRLTRASRDG